MRAVEHEDAEVARGNMHWSAAKRLRAAAASFLQQFRGLLRQRVVRFSNVIDIPISDGRGIGRQLRLTRGIEIEGQDLRLVFLSVGAGNHREIVEVPGANGLRTLLQIRLGSVAKHVAEKRCAYQKDGKHSVHKAI